MSARLAVPRHRRSQATIAVTAAAALLMACTGFITEPGEDESGGGSAGSGAIDTTKNALLPAPRVARLTHRQWENAVRDLFGLGALTGLSSHFPADPKVAGYLFDNDGQSLSIDQAHWSGYQRAATDLATQVMSDSAALARILPPAGASEESRAKTFIESFGRRVYRRPLAAEEVTRYTTLFQSAAALIPERPPFEAGVELTLTAMLQSPHFLYRVERSTAKSGSAIVLDGYEIASRLSFSLWDTMPDDALFTAAAEGKLSSAEGVAAEARRMIDDPRAADVVADFHRVLLAVDKYEEIKPLAALFPDVPADLGALAKKENDLYVRDIFDSGKGFRELLSSQKTFVNDELAALYGLSGTFGAEFEPTTLDPARRRGIFTQVGFLASNATSADPDPIHRGAFLVRRIACLPVSAPPGDIPPLPAVEPGMTNRQNVEQHTEQAGTDCVKCHGAYINPYGFPFESYDAVGRWRTTDNGKPVDTSATPPVDDVPTPVSGAVQLIDALATSKSVHECYARYWVEYAFGRKSQTADEGVVKHLGALSASGGGVKDFLVELVTLRAFRHRSQEDVQ